jgi:hypothetical protein
MTDMEFDSGALLFRQIRRAKTFFHLSRMGLLVTLKVEGHMQSSQNSPLTRTIYRRPRERKSIPPQDQRSWLLLNEAAVLVGCSHATIHRLRRGEIEGIPRLPAVQVGKRKWVVLKTTLEQWQRENESLSAA